jgi:hypothetical protein
VEEREEKERQRNRGHVSCGGRRIQPGKPKQLIEQMCQHRLANPAKGKRGNRNPELGPGDVPVEMLESTLNDLRAAITAGDHLVQFTAAGGDQRKLGGHEKTVDGDQSEYGYQTAGRYAKGWRVGGLRGNKSKDHKPVIYMVVET